MENLLRMSSHKVVAAYKINLRSLSSVMVGIWWFLVEVSLGVKEAKENSDKECISSP